jgi:hypothetical protein
MNTVDEATLGRFYDLSLIVNDIDGLLDPTIVPSSADLDFRHGLYLKPSPLRSIALWAEGDMWMVRYIELNIEDGSHYRLGDPAQVAPVGHPLLAEYVARMLARCGREIVSNVADRIIVPRETVADVFDLHLASAARMAFCARAWLLRNGHQPEW